VRVESASSSARGAARYASRVRPTDTSPQAQARMDAWYRSLTPTERGELLREAWHAGRELQLAGLRARFPSESEEQLELRLAERWLGAELFARVMAHKKKLGLG
jgi:uncharacterized protein YeaO (DUF488 family)